MPAPRQVRAQVPPPRSHSDTRAAQPATCQGRSSGPSLSSITALAALAQKHSSLASLTREPGMYLSTEYLPSFSGRFPSYAGAHPSSQSVQVCVHKRQPPTDQCRQIFRPSAHQQSGPLLPALGDSRGVAAPTPLGRFPKAQPHPRCPPGRSLGCPQEPMGQVHCPHGISLQHLHPGFVSARESRNTAGIGSKCSHLQEAEKQMC